MGLVRKLKKNVSAEVSRGEVDKSGFLANGDKSIVEVEYESL